MSQPEKRVIIFNCHRVGTPPEWARYRGMFVSPKILRFQIHLLRSFGYEFLTVSQAVQRSHGKIACITFDDGYRDNLALGLPVLKDIGVPATVYVITGDIGKSGITWPEAGERLPADLMTWDELRLLVKEGWEIGSHCHDHVHLTRQPENEQRRLIETSKEQIITHLGAAPQSFAYPFGSFDAVTVKILRQCGFSSAVSIKKGINSSRVDPLQLRRIPLKGYGARHYIRSLRLTLVSIWKSQKKLVGTPDISDPNVSSRHLHTSF